MGNFVVQNAITIKRLRSNENISIVFENNGKPLFQAFDKNTGLAAPDWSDDENRPIITPKVYSGSTGDSLPLTTHSWKYNGIPLTFNGAVSGDWRTDSTAKFQLNEVSGALKIIANLASEVNTANDTIAYTGVLTINGVDSTISKDAMIQIIQGGASSYAMTLLATQMILTDVVTSSVISSRLFLGVNEETDYGVRWYKDDQPLSDYNGQKSLTVTRSMVDGQATFFAEAYKSSEPNNIIARAAIAISDKADEFFAEPFISSANKELSDAGVPVTVSSRLRRQKDNSIYTPSSITYEYEVFIGDSPTPVKRVTTPTVTITNADAEKADASGKLIQYEPLVTVTMNFN